MEDTMDADALERDMQSLIETHGFANVLATLVEHARVQSEICRQRAPFQAFHSTPFTPEQRATREEGRRWWERYQALGQILQQVVDQDSGRSEQEVE
jgi:hypothetical protein